MMRTHTLFNAAVGCDGSSDSIVHFIHHSDPENAFETDRTQFACPVANHILEPFRKTHANTAMFHLGDDLACKFPTAKSTKGGRHITTAIFISTIFCDHKDPVRTTGRTRMWSDSRGKCAAMCQKCLW